MSASPGADMVCPACMAAFVAPYLGAGVADGDSSSSMIRWDVDDATEDGALAWVAASRHRVRAALYDGTLGPGARVRPTGVEASDAWALVGSVPEFARVLGLRGGDLAPLAGARKLAQVVEGTGRRPTRAVSSLGVGAGVDDGAGVTRAPEIAQTWGGGGPAPLRNASPGDQGSGSAARARSARPFSGEAPPMAAGRSAGRESAARDDAGRLKIPTLRANVPSSRVTPRTALLLFVGALAVGMAAWLASG